MESELLYQFKNYLERQYKYPTVQKYFSIFTKFYKFMQIKNRDILQLTVWDVIEFIDEYLKKYKEIRRPVGYFDLNRKFIKTGYHYEIKQRESKVSESYEELAKKAILAFIKFMAVKGNKYFEDLLMRIRIGAVDEFKFDVDIFTRQSEAKALSIDQVAELIKIFDDSPQKQAGVILSFWFGARTSEMSISFYKAYKNNLINFNECYIGIETVKRKKRKSPIIRHLPFPEVLSDHMKIWCKFLQKKFEIDKISDEMKARLLHEIFRRRERTIEKVIGFKVNPKHGRYTVRTHLEMVLPPLFVDYWMGHGYGLRAVGAAYRDPKKIVEILQNELIDQRKHFLMEIL